MGTIKKGKPKYNVQIHYRITAEEFLKRIREDPMSVFSDYDVRYAIEKLRSLCQSGRKDDLIFAKRILNEARLSAFIPKQAQERMTENENLRLLQANPFQFFQKIEEIKKKIQPFLQKRYTLYELDKKEEDIKKAYKSIYRQDLSEKEIEELTSGERDKDKTAVALFILSHRFCIPFESLKKFYYRVSKQEKQRQASLKPAYVEDLLEQGKKDKEYHKHVIENILLPEVFMKK